MTYKRKEKIGGLLSGVTFAGFSRPVTIYSIDCGTVVYVGSTTQPIEARVRSHVGSAKAGSDVPVHRWMRERGYVFRVSHLETCQPEDRVERERYWVEKFQGTALNVTDGGPGMSGNSFAGTGHAQKIGAKLRKGANCQCEVCQAEFWRKPRDMRLGHNRFCSRACYQQWQRGRPKKRGAL